MITRRFALKKMVEVGILELKEKKINGGAPHTGARLGARATTRAEDATGNLAEDALNV
jgi:hypothetical protein